MLENACLHPASYTAGPLFRVASKLLVLGAFALTCFTAQLMAADPAFSTLVSFPDTNGPYAGLTQTPDGSLYGTTLYGGTANRGTIFRISPMGEYTPLHSFTGGGEGSYPYATLTLGRDGFLYGTTTRGGAGAFIGTFFRFSTNGEFTVISPAAGDTPYGKLVQGLDGRFYGTTPGTGVAPDWGAVFRAGTNGNVVPVHTFTGNREGATPYAGVIIGRDGNFYGTTVLGGTNATAGFNQGTVFRLTPAGALTTLHTFNGTDGSYPYGGLVQAADGFLYGMSSGVSLSGGVPNYGAIFRVSTNGAFTNLYGFTAGADSQNPYSTLIQASDGALYGTTSGGTNQHGALFKITTGGAFSVLNTFNGGNGSRPYAGVIQALDGNLYGTTTSGGVNGGGTVYRYTLNAPPFIVEQPESLAVTNQNSATFTVVAGGTGPLSYRWMKGTTQVHDNGNIKGSTNNTLTIEHVTGADAGQYSVIVNNPYGNTPSAVAALNVTVVRPNVEVTSPKANAKTSNDVVTVTGTASGKHGVSAVYIQFNDETERLAKTSNGWMNWTADVTPAAGTNYIRAYASDSEGRISNTNTVRFFHVVGAPITVNVVGLGSVKPDYNGQELLVGRTYTMTAKPARGFKFMGWSGSATAPKAVLKFLMAPGLEFTATFADVMKPKNKLMSPRKRQRFTTDAISLVGKASDNAPGVSVYYQFNGGAWTLTDTTNSFTNWTAALTLQPGTNEIRTYAVDATGLTTVTSTVPVIYTPPQ